MGRKDVQTSSFAGSGSKTSFAEETEALSPTAKTRISLKPPSLWGRATEGSCITQQEQGELAKEEIVAEGECKQRDKKNIHFLDKCCSSGGTLERACASTPSSLFRHSAAREASSETPVPAPTLATRQGAGRVQDPIWLLIAASVSALINTAGLGPPFTALLPGTVAVKQMVGLGTLVVFAVG